MQDKLYILFIPGWIHDMKVLPAQQGFTLVKFYVVCSSRLPINTQKQYKIKFASKFIVSDFPGWLNFVNYTL